MHRLERNRALEVMPAACLSCIDSGWNICATTCTDSDTYRITSFGHHTEDRKRRLDHRSSKCNSGTRLNAS